METNLIPCNDCGRQISSEFPHCKWCGTLLAATDISTSSNGFAHSHKSGASTPNFHTVHTKQTTVGAIFHQRWELLSPLGQGGMGIVYRARDMELNEEVAVKVMPRSLSTHQKMVDRFEREARGLSQLQHPNIVSYLDAGHTSREHFLVMELVPGVTLSQMSRASSTLTDSQINFYLSQLLEGIQYLHSKKFIHRDLKPQNVIVDAGVLKILDFGLVKIMESEEIDLNTLTSTHQAFGTPPYMSPEQCVNAGAIDFRADIYSAGVMLYELATGQLPFSGESPMSIMHAHLYETPPPPREINPNLSLKMEKIILKALAKAPHERFQSALEFKNELNRLNNSESKNQIEFAETAMAAGSNFPSDFLSNNVNQSQISRLEPSSVTGNSNDEIITHNSMLTQVKTGYQKTIFTAAISCLVLALVGLGVFIGSDTVPRIGSKPNETISPTIVAELPKPILVSQQFPVSSMKSPKAITLQSNALKRTKVSSHTQVTPIKKRLKATKKVKRKRNTRRKHRNNKDSKEMKIDLVWQDGMVASNSEGETK